MPLPPPEAIEKIQRALILARAQNRELRGSFDEVRDLLTKFLKMVATGGVQSAITGGISAGAGASQVTLHVGTVAGIGLSYAVMPIGQAIAPWIGVAVIASRVEGIWGFHDLKTHAKSKGAAYYSCSCGKCAEGLQYVIDKKENNQAIMAVGIFTAGLAILGDRLISVGKHFMSDRPKERHTRQFIESARGGCVNAMATILFMCGKWPKDKPPEKALLIEAIACVLADDGWKRLKSKW
jgi:hypothetical protein